MIYIAVYTILLLSLSHPPAALGAPLGSGQSSDLSAGRRHLLHRVGEFVPNDPSAVPSFLIIGAGKGGTTDLHAQLTDESVNSDPERPDPPLVSGERKEVGVLQSANLTTADVTPFAPFFRDYLALLRHPCANYNNSRLRDCLTSPGSAGGGTTSAGDDSGNTATAASSFVYTMDATPRYHISTIAPLLLRTFSPNSKVLLMLRDPVDRAESLYNHMAQDARGEIFLTRTMDEITTDFLDMLDSNPDLRAILRRLASCPAIAATTGAVTGGGGSNNLLRCMAAGWQDFMAMGLADKHEWRMILNGFYNYALAAWRLHYFQPGRVMVIDAHTYFRDREGVIEKVIAFLYGRGMTTAERHLAQHAAGQNVRHRHETINSTTAGGTSRRVPAPPSSQPPWMLSPTVRARLQQLYDTHVLQGLHQTLDGLREEGAWIVGFDGAPWPWPS